MENNTEISNDYIPVSPALLFSETSGNFRIYLKQGERFVLYADNGDSFTEGKKKKLHDLDVRRVYMPLEDKPEFDSYFESHLGEALFNEKISPEERCRTFYDASLHMVEKLFSDDLPSSLSKDDIEPIRDLMKNAVKFLQNKDVCEHLGKLITYDFSIYKHSVNVFVLALILMGRHESEESLMMDTGIGAILHDVGKLKLPIELVSSHGDRTPEQMLEYKKHPELGLELCKDLHFSTDTVNVILLHHEVLDGTGYPKGLLGYDLPLNVRIVSAVNAYDNLVGGKKGKNMQPFQALSYMSREMESSFDQEVVVSLVRVLGGVKE
jgi:HD-GYP domain-containing protein (c-di-GMP phosphodiesterase class II)